MPKKGKVVRMPGKEKRVVFADFSSVKFNALRRWLEREQVRSDMFSDVPSLIRGISEEPFDVAIVNLLLGGFGPFQFISRLKKASRNREIRVIVLSKQVHKGNIENSVKAGANDFVADPFEDENLFNRIVYHLRPNKVLEQPDVAKTKVTNRNEAFARALLETIDLLSKTKPDERHRTFLEIVQRLARLVESNRTSLIIVDKNSASGVVLASSDDPDFHDFAISLDKYPEILHIMNTGSIAVVEDVSQNVLTRDIKKKVSSIKIGSIMVFPIYYQAEVVGVLNIRRPEATQLPDAGALAMVQAVANTVAAHANTENVLRKIYKQYATDG